MRIANLKSGQTDNATNNWINPKVTKLESGQQKLIKSIADIVVSKPKQITGLLNSQGYKVDANANPTILGKMTIAAISKSRKFAEHLADMIIDGDFSATGDKKGTVILMGRTFGAKNPFFNAKGQGLVEDVTANEPIADNIVLQNQIAMDKAIEEASEEVSENVLGGGGMSIGVKISIALVAVTVVIAGLKIAKVI